jgi:hypothetical protein
MKKDNNIKLIIKEKEKKPRSEKQILATQKMVEAKRLKKQKAQENENQAQEKQAQENQAQENQAQEQQLEKTERLDSSEKVNIIQDKLEEIRLRKISHMERIKRIWIEEKQKKELLKSNELNITVD